MKIFATRCPPSTDTRTPPETKQARHVGTLGSGIDAAVLGVYVHCLLLSTGNILVPIVAHAVFDAILFVAGHVNVSPVQWKAGKLLCFEWYFAWSLGVRRRSYCGTHHQATLLYFSDE